MTTRLQIPRILQRHCQGKAEINISGSTVGEVLRNVERQYPPLYRCICDETGRVRTHLSLFLNDKLLLSPATLQAPVQSGDVVSVFQAVSGG